MSLPGPVNGVVDASVHVFCPVIDTRLTEVNRNQTAIQLHLPSDLEVTRHGKDRTARPVRRHQVRRPVNNQTSSYNVTSLTLSSMLNGVFVFLQQCWLDDLLIHHQLLRSVQVLVEKNVFFHKKLGWQKMPEINFATNCKVICQTKSGLCRKKIKNDLLLYLKSA